MWLNANKPKVTVFVRFLLCCFNKPAPFRLCSRNLIFDFRLEFVLKSNFQSGKKVLPAAIFLVASGLHAFHKMGCLDSMRHLQQGVVTPRFTYSSESRLQASHAVWRRNFMLHLQRGVATLRFIYSGKSRLITVIQSWESIFKNL
jgi:hypothetical protein